MPDFMTRGGLAAAPAEPAGGGPACQTHAGSGEGRNAVHGAADAFCAHDRLICASGGFYLACLDCGVRWVAVGSNRDDDLDRSRRMPVGSSALRVSPRLVPVETRP